MTGSKNAWQEGSEHYQAFLLRCWQEGESKSGGESQESFNWRFALVQLNDRSNPKCFARLEDLIVFLRNKLEQAATEDEAPSKSLFQQRKAGSDRIVKHEQD